MENGKEENQELNLETFFGKTLDHGITGKLPRLEFPWFFHGQDHFRDALTEPMEHAMYYAYYWDHFCESDTMRYLWGGVDPKKRTLTETALREEFPAYYAFPQRGYTFETYASKPFPWLEQREATYAIVFTDGRRVAFSLDNTYKYQDWSELFEDMIGSDGMICQRRGLHRAFVIYTDSSDTLPYWTLYEKTVAGFAVDSEKRTLTAYPPESAVLIFHSLYQLCSAEYGCFIGVTGRTGPKHTFDDSAAAAGDDPYVKAFRERLEQYRDRYDEQALLKAFDNH